MASSSLNPLGPSSATLGQRSALCRTLLNPSTLPEKRAEELGKLTLELIDQPLPWPKIGKRQFTHRHLSSHMENTRLEGGRSKVSITYWKTLFDFWKKGEGQFLEIDLPSNQLKILEEIVEEYHDFLNLIEELRTSKEKIDFEVEAEKILLRIHQVCQKRGYCYFSLGYEGSVYSQGHAIPVHIQLKKDTVTIHFLNLGAGVEQHPNLKWDGTENYFHFRFFPIEFSSEDFFGEVGRQIFARQLQLQTLTSNEVTGYDPEDVYGPFKLLGKVKGTFSTSLALREKKPQLGATCADMAVELIIRDVLLDQGCTKPLIKRLFCAEHLVSLVSFYHEIKETKDLESLKMLALAIEEMAIHIHNLPKNLLNDSELLICETIFSSLKQRILRIQDAFPKESLKLPCFLNFDQEALILPERLSSPNLKSVLPKERAKTLPPQPFSTLAIFPFVPQEFDSSLNRWKHAYHEIKQVNSTGADYFLYRLMLSLPLPSHSVEDPWNSLPLARIPAVIEDFLSLCVSYYNTAIVEALDERKKAPGKLLLHTGLVIIDKLCRRLDQNLKGFLPLVGLQLFKASDSQANQQSDPRKAFYPMGEENRRYAEICDYFSILSASATHTVFHFDREINIQLTLKRYREQKNSASNQVSHLHFLLQYHKEALKNGLDSFSSYEKQIAELWCNPNQKYLPGYVEHFERMAYLCFESLFGTDRKKSSDLHIEKKTLVNQGTFVLMPGCAHFVYPSERAAVLSYSYSDDESQRKKLEHTFLESKRTSNQALTLPKHADWESQKAHREWARIFATPSLQIVTTLSWIQKNIDQFSRPVFRQCVEMALFTSDLLQVALKNEPHLCQVLRKSVSEGIDFYRKTNKGVFLFFIRLGICSESHIAEAFNRKINREILINYEKDLIEEKKELQSLKSYWNTLFLIYKYGLPNGNISLQYLVEGCFYLKYHFFQTPTSDAAGDSSSFHKPSFHPSPDPDWVYFHTAHLCQIYENECIAASKNEGWMDTLRSRVFNLLNIVHEHELITFDLTTFDLIKGEAHLELIDAYGQQLFWCDPDTHTYVSLNGKERLQKTSDYIPKHQKLFSEVSKTNWYTRVYIKQLEKRNPVLYKHILNSLYASCWIFSDEFFASMVIEEDGERYLIKDSKKGSKIEVLSTKNKKESLLFFKESNDRIYLLCYFFAIRFGGLNPSEVRICVNEETGHVSWIRIPRFHLKFFAQTTGNKWVLECAQLPGYYISQEQLIAPLNFFSGALILENSMKKRVALIPNTTLVPVYSDFSTRVTLGSQFPDAEQPFYLYSIDDERNLLISENARANSHLVLFFAFQRDYKRALEYLARSRSYAKYSEREMAHYSDFLEKIPDQSSAAVAFCLRIGLHLIENQNQLTLSNYEVTEQQKKLKFFQDLTKSLVNFYYSYLRHLSIKTATRIPGELRLTYSEEKVIVSFLLEHLSSESPFYHRFSSRKAILDTDEGIEHPIQSSSRTTYPLSLYKMISFDGDLNTLLTYGNQFNYSSEQGKSLIFVRITFHDFLCRFPEFYTRAQTGLLHDLDLFYLAQTFHASSHRTEMKKFIRLLDYVRKYPKAFAHLKLSETDPTIFLKIITLCNSYIAQLFQSSNLLIDYYKTVRFSFFKTSALVKPAREELKRASLTFTQPERDALKEAADKEIHTLLYTHFEPLAHPPSPEKRPFVPSAFSGTTPIEKELSTTLKQGFTKYQEKLLSDRPLILKTSSSLSMLISETMNLIKQKRDLVTTLKHQAESLANTIPDYKPCQAASRALNFGLTLRKIGRDLPWIGIDQILTDAFTKRDPVILQAANPSLNPQQLKTLFFLTAQYHIALVTIERLEQALIPIFRKDEDALQHFAELCKAKTFYDCLTFPELLVFSSRTKKLYRQNQAELLNWHFKTKSSRRVISFPTGGGKTDLFQPLLTQTSLAEGKFVVIFSPHNQFSTDREKLKNALYFSFRQNLAIWELEIDTKLELGDLNRIYAGIKKCKEHNLPLHTTPITYLSAELQYRLALENKEEEKVGLWSEILALFSDEKQASLFVFEESRQTASPLTQAKIGLGKPLKVPKLEQELFLEIYRLLIAPTFCLRDGRSVSSILKLTSQDYCEISATDLKEITLAIAEEIVRFPLLKLDVPSQKIVLPYLKDASVPRPAILDSLPQAPLIDLAQSYLWEFLPAVMKLVRNVEHKLSSDRFEEFDTPTHQGRSTGAQYESPYSSIILSIQGYLSRGLSSQQCLKFAEKAIRLHKQSNNNTLENSPQALIESCTGEKGLLNRDPWSIRNALMEHHTNPILVLWYLEHIVLDQVTYSNEKIEVSPKHLIHAARETVFFSATPGPLEIYGLYTQKEKEEAFFVDDTFAPAVIHQMNAPQNQKVYRLKTSSDKNIPETPFQFFKHLYALDPSLFDRLGMICDVGSHFRLHSGVDVTEGFFQFLAEMKGKVEYDGMIYFRPWKNSTHQLVFEDFKNNKLYPLISGDIVASLNSLGFKWDSLKLLTFCPYEEIIGFNGCLKKMAYILVLLGENLPQSNAIQGVNRGRGFLQDQSVGWVINENMATKLEKQYQQPCSPELFTQWMQANEAQKIEQEILADAYLEIDYLMESPLRTSLKQAWKNPKLQIKLWHKHRTGLVKPNHLRHTPEPLIKEDSDKVLEKYATQVFQSYKYSHSSWKEIPRIKRRVNELIANVKMRLAKISTRSSSQSLAEIHVQTQQQTEKIQETESVQLIQAEPAMPLQFPNLDKPGLNRALMKLTSSAQLAFESNGLSSNLFLTKDALQSAKLKGVSLGIKYFKPIQFILCVQEDQALVTYAVSDEEAALLQSHLLALNPCDKPPHQLFLLNSEGILVQNGPQKLGISDPDYEKLKQTDAFKNILVDIHLLSQEIYDIKLLARRFETWEDIWSLWTKISAASPFTESPSAQHIENLIPDKFKFKLVAPSSATEKSWLLDWFSSILH